MNLAELKTKVDEAIEQLGEEKPENIEVKGHFDLNLQVSLNTPTGATFEFKEKSFEVEGLEIQSIDFDGGEFTIMLAEE